MFPGFWPYFFSADAKAGSWFCWTRDTGCSLALGAAKCCEAEQHWFTLIQNVSRRFKARSKLVKHGALKMVTARFQTFKLLCNVQMGWFERNLWMGDFKGAEQSGSQICWLCILCGSALNCHTRHGICASASLARKLQWGVSGMVWWCLSEV